MSARPRYNVVVKPVREVQLRGTADFSFWQQRLRDQQLSPAPDADGKAQLLLLAVDTRFMGVRFRELSLAVTIAEAGSEEAVGVYLPQAFNSVRLFAWVERTFYHTPYHRADVHVETGMPAGFEVSLREGVILRAEMEPAASAESRPAVRSDEETWEGPIFLPRAAGQQQNKLFFARLTGDAAVYSFSAQDKITLVPTARAPAIDWLAESEFSPSEWLVRQAGIHARSKSVVRDSVQLSPAGLAG